MGLGSNRKWRMVQTILLTALIAGLTALGAPRSVCAQEQVPVAPDAPPRFSAYAVDWARFNRLASVARETAASDRLADVARALRASVPPEAGRMSPLDWYCLGSAWHAYHYPVGKGRPYLRTDISALEGEELYTLLRKGYRLGPNDAARINARLLTMLGVPSEALTGLVRDKGIDRGAWILSQVGSTWMRADISGCLPSPTGEWHPAPGFLQSSSDLDGVLAFLKTHLPDGEVTARPQGLKKPLALPDWEAWDRSIARLRTSVEAGGENLLFASKIGLFIPSPIGDEAAPDHTTTPANPDAISAVERLRRKPYKPTRGELLAATARKYVGLPYVWGGENPNNGFDCSGLMQFVCRTWGISIPRTAAEQYHVGKPVSFMDLEPGDMIFLANTYKPGVSHVGMYIGDGQWVQAQGSATGIIVCDVPYFDAGSGPGARRLDLSRLPRTAGEPAPIKPPNRASVVASRHATEPRPAAPRATAGGIVSVKICGDSGDIANNGCTTYKLARLPKSQLKTMHRCTRHKPLGGERW